MRERWALVLAGGDGRRLEPLTRLIHHDDRPKQFATILGPETLLDATLRRMAELIPPDRTLIVLTRKHEQFYQTQLDAHKDPRPLVQPEPRGTAAAICWGMGEITKLDPDAIVGLIPSDHFYSNEPALLAAMTRAYSEADRTGQVIILGATPEGPETSYGWIELGESCQSASVAVTALWEKPDARVAQSLFEKGCLWNTFILVGAVSAFVRLVHDTRPELELFFPRAKESLTIDDIYRQIEPIDFSHEVIVPSGSKLRTVCLGNVGWSDLGEPERAMAIMMEHGTPEQKVFASTLLLQSSPGGP